MWVDAKILFWSHLKSSESWRPRSSDSFVGWIYTKRFIAQTLVDSESESESEVAQSCLTLCDPIDCSLSVSSVHGIFQARVPEWGAIAFSRGSSWPRDQTWVSHIVGRCFTVWATWIDSEVNTKTQYILKSYRLKCKLLTAVTILFMIYFEVIGSIRQIFM